jgi:hypothetical protein
MSDSIYPEELKSNITCPMCQCIYPEQEQVNTIVCHCGTAFMYLRVVMYKMEMDNT